MNKRNEWRGRREGGRVWVEEGGFDQSDKKKHIRSVMREVEKGGR